MANRATRSKATRVTSKTGVGPFLDAAEAGERVLLERDGIVFRLSREVDIAYEPDAEFVRKTLRVTAGTWEDLDIDRVIEDLYGGA
jgi:hypothetical protein